MSTLKLPDGVEVTGPVKDRYEKILSPKALELIAKLHRDLNARRLELLAAREERVKKVAAGEDLDFLPETKNIREDDSWKVAPLAPGLEDRRVEMTGPTDRKMVINALNSGAKAAARSRFEGCKQRFFGALLLSSKLPPVIAAIDRARRSVASNTGGLSSCMSFE